MYSTAMVTAIFPRAALFVLLTVAPLQAIFPAPHVAIEAAGVTDLYGDVTGFYDLPLEWGSVALGLVDMRSRDVFLTFHAGDVYIGGSLSTEIHPSPELGYYLFVRVDGWLNTFGGNASQDVAYLTIPIGIGFTVPLRSETSR